MERAMGIEQIRMNQTKALPPVFQFNWSQMESNLLNAGLLADLADLCFRPVSWDMPAGPILIFDKSRSRPLAWTKATGSTIFSLPTSGTTGSSSTLSGKSQNNGGETYSAAESFKS